MPLPSLDCLPESDSHRLDLPCNLPRPPAGPAGPRSALATARATYSIGFGLPANAADLLSKIPDEVWQVAYDADGQVATRRGSPSSPACSTCPAGPRACASSLASNARTPARSYAPPTSTGCASPRFAQQQARATRPPRTAPPPPGPLRRSHPRRQGHRAAEPAAARHGPFQVLSTPEWSARSATGVYRRDRRRGVGRRRPAPASALKSSSAAARRNDDREDPVGRVCASALTLGLREPARSRVSD